METWLNMNKISEQSGIPYTTARRILVKFTTFFDHRKRKNQRLYKQSQIPLLQRIHQLYKDKYRTNEIMEMLKNSEPQTIDTIENEGVITTKERPSDSLYKTLEIIGSQKQLLEVQSTQINVLVDKVSNLENEKKEMDKTISDLKRTMLQLEAKHQKENAELLQEVNQMMLEMMKGMRK